MNANNRLIALFAGVITLALAVPASQAAIAQAASFDEKVDNAAAIILGKCVRTESRFDSTGRWILTYATFQVEKSMKGGAAGEVTVVTPGGQVGSLHQETIGITPFHKGDEHVVFIRNTRVGPTVLYFDQGRYDVQTDEHGQKVIIPMRSNVVTIDAQRGMAIAPNDEPRTIEQFQSAVAESMKGTARRLQMSTVPRTRPPAQKGLMATLADNKLLVALAIGGLLVAAWQLTKRA